MIINLTQHTATSDQLAAGVVDLPHAARQRLVDALTVNAPPTQHEIIERARFVAHLVSGDSIAADGLQADVAMIGGAPWMMRALEDALLELGIQPVYAFSVRESTEQIQPDGGIRKVAVFRHAGFIRAVV